jgi:hypothetical protein
MASEYPLIGRRRPKAHIGGGLEELSTRLPRAEAKGYREFLSIRHLVAQ